MSTPNPFAPRIPKQVRDQAAVAEAALALATGQAPPTPPEPPTPPAAAAEATPPEGAATQPPPDVPVAGTPEAITTAPAAATPPAGDQATLQPDVAGLQGQLAAANQRYAVLQGMQQATAGEVAELRALNRELQDSVLKLTERLGGGGTRPSTPPATTAVTVNPQQDELDAQFVSPEGLEVIKRQAKEAAEREVAARVAPLERRAQQEAVASFENQVTSLVPDWDTVEQDARFQPFMQSQNPTTGEPYGEGLKRAIARGDARVVANLYNTFKRSAGMAVASGPAATPAPPAPPKPIVQPLESRVAPTGASAASAPVPAAEATQYFTETEYAAGIKEIAIHQGKVFGKRKQELDALAAALNLAAMNGRIRKG